MVATFLAVLELVKSKRIVVDENGQIAFGGRIGRRRRYLRKMSRRKANEADKNGKSGGRCIICQWGSRSRFPGWRRCLTATMRQPTG